jgi:hypothetical protein
MNLTWHIVRKDLRRFWPLLVVPCLVALLRFGVGIHLLGTNDTDSASFNHMAVYAHVLWGVGLFITYMLVAAVIQEDSVASPAFWQTRPISRLRLLAAKALGLGLMFGLLPVILSVPWWLGCGFGWNEIGRAAAETLAIQMAVVVLALPWAVVTGHYGRFLLWTVVAVVAWATAVVLLAERLTVSPSSLSPGTGVTRLLVIAALAAAGGLGVAAHQFLSRRTWRSIVLIICVAATMVAAGLWWTGDASALWALKPIAPGSLAKDITVSFEDAYAYTASPEGNSVAEARLYSKGFPPGYLLSLLYSKENLRWADGSVSEQTRFNMWGNSMFVGHENDLLHVAPDKADERWLRYAMRRNLYPSMPEKERQWTVEFPIVLSPRDMKKLRSEKPEFDGAIWFRLLQADKIGEGPLLAGTVLEKGKDRTRIAVTGFDDEAQVLRLSLVERAPEYLWRDLLASVELATRGDAPVYGVVNQGRTFMSEGFIDTMDHALIANVAITLRKEAFAPRRHWNALTRKWEKDHDGFAGATLAEIVYQEAERFSIPVKIDHFALHSFPAHKADGAPPERYTVSGEAARPGAFPLYPEETVVNALRTAGGVSERADLKNVVLIRTRSDGTTTQTLVDVEAWLEGRASSETIPVLQPGDVVSVPVGTPPESPSY